MEELANLIANYGVSIIIVALFLWDWICNKKDTKATLNVIKESNENISKTLELLQRTMDNVESKLDKTLERK